MPTLRNPMDCSLPGSSVHGIFQARLLEWGAIAFSTFSLLPPNTYILDLISKDQIVIVTGNHTEAQ